MTIRVRLFAAYREAVGAGELELPAQAGMTVGAVWQSLVTRHPALAGQAPAAALNARLVEADTPLDAGDELAFLPPVSGG